MKFILLNVNDNKKVLINKYIHNFINPILLNKFLVHRKKVILHQFDNNA